MAIALCAAVAVAQAGAAEAPAGKAGPAAAAPSPAAPALPPQSPSPPPYQAQLLRLAEMMGALAYLRDLCGQGDSAEFRSKMAALLDAVDAERRDLVAGAYNKGFRDYASSYRACGPAASAVIERYLTETARIAADLAARYGG